MSSLGVRRRVIPIKAFSCDKKCVLEGVCRKNGLVCQAKRGHNGCCSVSSEPFNGMTWEAFTAHVLERAIWRRRGKGSLEMRGRTSHYDFNLVSKSLRFMNG